MELIGLRWVLVVACELSYAMWDQTRKEARPPALGVSAR